MNRLLTQRRLRVVAAAAVLCAMVSPTITHSSPAHGGFTALAGPAGPLQPPAAALQPIGATGNGSRPMGLARSPHAAFSAHFASRLAVNTASLPASADLTQYNPSVGNQGQVGSCAAWATGYYLRGWYAIRDGYYPPAGSGPGAGFAPMFLYSRSGGGVDNGSSIEYNLAIMEQGISGAAGYGQGIDTRADYTQGDFDYTDAPTTAEITNAAKYKIKSYAVYDPASTGLNLEDWIKTSIAGGSPVVLGIPVYNNFYYATSSSYLVGVPAAGSTLFGYHAIFADKYDANGVWIENQWGTWWGLNGWVELGWDFINWLYTNPSVWYDADAMTPLPAASGTATPTATATATSSPTGSVTSTPAPAGTGTQTAVPTSTRTSTATGTATQRPTSTATPRPTSTATPHPTSTPRKLHR